MARALVLGNGNFSVCLDQYGFVRDMYFPYVGLENHVLGKKHRIGVQVNGSFSWVDDGSWEISLGYQPETMVGYLVCKNPKLNLSLVMEDAVYNEADVFVRRVDIYNHGDVTANIRLFFGQEFLISENKKRNTGFYDPTHNAVVHYKGRRIFIVNGMTESGNGIDQYTVGAFQFEGKEGSFRDAEDGELSKNAVEHGSVDSVVRFCMSCEAKQKTTMHYWICAAKLLDEAYQLNQQVIEKTPDGILHSTKSFWNAWLNKKNYHLGALTPEQQKLFDTSLFILRAHTDDRGSIIASTDSEMMEYGKDDYSYMWPRDAAFIVTTLDSAGFTEVTKPFFQFCQRVLHPDGYLHHRFRSDESLGSTWHSTTSQKEWLKDRILQLPIQEDETASVIVALWKHYEITKDLEFVEGLFQPMIAKMAEFMVNFVDQNTGLPLASYDLWEEKIGVSTYTCAAVYGGLMAAAKFADLLGKRNHMRRYKDTAKKIKAAAITHLFDPDINAFIRYAQIEDGQIIRDKIVDASSLFGLWYFGMFELDDTLLMATVEQVDKRLRSTGPTGGFIRYEADAYFRSQDLSNPWFITTLWEVQRRLRQPDVSDQDLEYAKQTFQWVIDHLYPSGVLAEQLDPYSGTSLSATPLVWSHAVYIETVLLYVNVLERKGLCTDCALPRIPEL